LIRWILWALLAFAPMAQGADPQWLELLTRSHENLERTQLALEKEFQLSAYDRWDVSQDTGELVFSDSERPDVVARVIFVGSYAFSSQTWLWGWANESIDESLTSALARVRRHGLQHRFRLLTERGWSSQEEEGWDMAAVTNYLLGGKGVYRGPSESSILWMVITDIRRDEDGHR
jgi:hypothetical protein